MRLYCLPVVLLIVLSACASGPTFDTRLVDRSLTPDAPMSRQQDSFGKQVLWGGVILTTTNLKDRTRLEVLAYPLDTSNRPQRDEDPQGRFIIEQSGYLEPADYAQGRLVTVLGTVSGRLPGKVGDSDYSYQLINPAQLHLWPKQTGKDKTSVHFGIGLGVGF